MPDTTLTGVAGVDTVVATLSPIGYDRAITRLRVNGPSPSSFDAYVGAINDSCRVTTTTRGDSNSADFSNPIRIPAGYVTYFVWSDYDVAETSTVTIGMERSL